MFNYRNKYNKGKKRAVADQHSPSYWKVCLLMHTAVHLWALTGTILCARTPVPIRVHSHQFQHRKANSYSGSEAEEFGLKLIDSEVKGISIFFILTPGVLLVACH